MDYALLNVHSSIFDLGSRDESVKSKRGSGETPIRHACLCVLPNGSVVGAASSHVLGSLGCITALGEQRKNLPLYLLIPHAWSCPCAYAGVVLFGQIRIFFIVVSGGGHFQDRPILPEVHDFSDLSLGSLVIFGFAALGPFSGGRSHMLKTARRVPWPMVSMLCMQ